MSFLVKGINRLSQIEIDADKNWQGKEISDLKAVAAGMSQGDIVYRGNSLLERLAPVYGVGFNFLKMTNTGHLEPAWEDIQDLIVFLTGAVNRAVTLPVLGISQPDIDVSTILSVAGRSEPGRVLAVPEAVLTGDVSGTTVNAVGGAISHNEDVGDTDETSESNDAIADDMTLLPADGATEDYYALGYAARFDGVVVNVGVAGADITLAYEYSKGAGVWGTLTPVVNEISNWDNTGKHWFTFLRPLDWFTDTLGSISDKYWIRFRAEAIGGSYVQSFGTQAWMLVYS